MPFHFNPFTSDLDKVSVEDLSGYIPYTGATTNVDLGVRTLTTTGTMNVAADDVAITLGASGGVTDSRIEWDGATSKLQFYVGNVLQYELG